MAFKICQTCGRTWSDDDAAEANFTALKFSTTSNPAGSLLTVEQMVNLGPTEEILTCPADPDARLDEAIKRSGNLYNEKDRIADDD